MRKTSAYARKKRRIDPMGGLRLISELKPFDQAERTNLSLPVRMAYEAVKSGRGDENDMDTLAAIVNVSLIRCEQEYPDYIDVCKEAQQAVMHIKDRYLKSGKLGMSGQDMQDLLPVLDLHEQLIELSTPKQMMDAMKEVLKRIDQKHVLES